MTIKIRGIASVKDENELLVIIDGVPSSSKFNELNPDLIESIEIIKPDEAKGIYGAKGASGALVITTKGNAIKKKYKSKKLR